jgi:hypothetical protein
MVANRVYCVRSWHSHASQAAAATTTAHEVDFDFFKSTAASLDHLQARRQADMDWRG